MDREAAAALLGVSSSATPAEINSAYRKAARTYHPDAWRSKTEAEQKQASEIYSKLSGARKTLLAPPEPDPSPSFPSQGYSSGAQSSSQNTGAAPNWSSSSPSRSPSGSAEAAQFFNVPQQQSAPQSSPTSASGHRKYNRATDFTDSFGQMPDPQEELVFGEYAKETKSKYKSAKDVFKSSFSVAPTILTMLALALTLLGIVPVLIPGCSITAADVSSFIDVDAQQGSYVSTEALTPFDAAGALPLLIILAVLILKMIVYDFIVSYHIMKRVSLGLKITIAGAEGVIMTVASMFFLYGKYDVSNIAIAAIISGIAVVAGVLIFIVQKFVKKNKEKTI